MKRLVTVLMLVGPMMALSGCGALAFPCRVISAGLDIVPVVGHTLAAPTNLCAAAID